jgi:ribosome biogenesis GTPase
MRESKRTEVAFGINAVFTEIESKAEGCRYSDCSHESEASCAVLESGEINSARLNGWKKLGAVERRNNASLAERRARDKDFGNMVRPVVHEKKQSRPR